MDIARRGLARAESELSRVRAENRDLERRFEADCAPMRATLRSLGLDSSEDLIEAASRHSEGVERVESLRASAARSEFSPEAEAELHELDALAGDVGAHPVEFDPEGLFAAAIRGTSIPSGELGPTLRPILPVYVRALTHGTYTDLRPEDGTWRLRPADGSDSVALSDAPPDDARRGWLALRLALLESLGSHARVPLLIGPDPHLRDARDLHVLARALRRLSRIVQVVQFASEDGDWTEAAPRVERLA
jgi:hypothetical protein